jgi:TPP-dependent pyruvate/acetoin dehydrogenase alpha subunit
MSRLGKRQLHELYYYLKLTRSMEEEIARLHREAKVGGAIFFGVGQEAVSIGAAYRLGSGDFISSSLPSLGSLLVRGVNPFEIFAHFMGKNTGLSRGRDCSIYFGDLSRGLVSPGGHSATHMGVMAGMALAAKFAGAQVVGVAVVEKKAVSTGDFHEGLNFAAVHQLPLVVIVDHDHVTPLTSSSTGGPYLYERTKGYGVPSLPVDGVDILQVLQVVETAVERARAGRGPTLIEVSTVRGAAHGLRDGSIPFPFETRGRSAGESLPVARNENNAHDPVRDFEAFLFDHGLMLPVERELILDEIRRVLQEGLQKAEEEPFPETETVSEGVYRSGPNGFQLDGAKEQWFGEGAEV